MLKGFRLSAGRGFKLTRRTYVISGLFSFPRPLWRRGGTARQIQRRLRGRRRLFCRPCFLVLFARQRDKTGSSLPPWYIFRLQSSGLFAGEFGADGARAYPLLGLGLLLMLLLLWLLLLLLCEGVLNVIHGGHEAVNFVCDAPDVKAISFVGGNQVSSSRFFACLPPLLSVLDLIGYVMRQQRALWNPERETAEEAGLTPLSSLPLSLPLPRFSFRFPHSCTSYFPCRFAAPVATVVEASVLT